MAFVAAKSVMCGLIDILDLKYCYRIGCSLLFVQSKSLIAAGLRVVWQ